MTDSHRVHFESPTAEREVAECIEMAVRRLGVPRRRLLYMCIGTDRSTGDALGPLVGERLAPAVEELEGLVDVLGTLREPIHAANLPEALRECCLREPAPAVVAIDACLGRVETVGMVTIGVGPLSPGAGVNKSLPAVGSAFVTGTVNVGGFMEYFVLQNTRLHLVMQMAELIANGLARGARSAFASGKSETAPLPILAAGGR